MNQNNRQDVDELSVGGCDHRNTTPTCQYGAPLALLLHISVFPPRQGERCLEHEAVDVVMPFEIGHFLLLLLLIEVGHHVGHLDVGELWVQVFRVDLKHFVGLPTQTSDVIKCAKNQEPY